MASLIDQDIFYLGRYRQGDWVGINLSTSNGAGTPSAPTATPTITTWDLSDLSAAIETLRPYARDPKSATGFFSINLLLDTNYPVGRHGALCEWSISGTDFQCWVFWDVIAGGDSVGNVTASQHCPRPEADWIIYQRDNGSLVAGRNPR